MKKILLLSITWMVVFAGCNKVENSIRVDSTTPVSPTLNPSESPSPTQESVNQEEPLVEILQPSATQVDNSGDEGTLLLPTITVKLPEMSPTPAEEEVQVTVEVPAPDIVDYQIPQAAFVIEDLSRRLGIDPSSIKTVEVAEIDWNNNALGCPAPGMMYLQVITPGFRITLEAMGKTYDYHTDMGDYFVLCVDGRPQKPID